MTRDDVIEQVARIFHGYDPEALHAFEDESPESRWMRAARKCADAGLLREESWGALMALLDKHWPEDVFPTPEERPEWSRRDPGPTIVGLIRWVDQLRGGSNV